MRSQPPSATSIMLPSDLEFWSKRFALFHDAAETALDILRNYSPAAFLEFIASVEVEWRGEANNCFVVFPHDSKLQQEEFFKAVEEVCRAGSGISKNDHQMYVQLTPLPPSLTTTGQASSHVPYCASWDDHHGHSWVRIPHRVTRFL